MFNLNILFCKLTNTYENAERFLITRRKLLPAIYNTNLERYHWFVEMSRTPDQLAVDSSAPFIKPEPDTICFLGEPGLIIVGSDDGISDSDGEDMDSLHFNETTSDNETDGSNAVNENNYCGIVNKDSNVPLNIVCSHPSDSISFDKNTGVKSHTEVLENNSDYGDTYVGDSHATVKMLHSLVFKTLPMILSLVQVPQASTEQSLLTELYVVEAQVKMDPFHHLLKLLLLIQAKEERILIIHR